MVISVMLGFIDIVRKNVNKDMVRLYDMAQDKRRSGI
jgi:hypothetical protein